MKTFAYRVREALLLVVLLALGVVWLSTLLSVAAWGILKLAVSRGP